MHAFLSSLRFNLVTAALMVIEVCLALAVTVNALFLIAVHLSAMKIEPGVATQELAWVQASGAGQRSMDASVLMSMKNLQGVKGAIKINSVPLGGNAWTADFRTDDAQSKTLPDVAVYLGTEGTLDVLGSQLVSGRDFLPEEYVDFDMLKGDPPPGVIIVTSAFAHAAWPGANPLGKRIWFAGTPVRVVGVVKALVAPSFRNVGSSQMSVIAPVRRVASDIYALRVDAKMRDKVLSGLPRLLSSLNRAVLISGVSSFEAAQDAYFHDDKALIWLLLFVTGVLLAITVLGIAGLSSFWVFKRTRSIGIRRALGATRGDIVRYFAGENLAVTACGVLLGAGAAIGVNFWLMENYEVPKLSYLYVVLGALLLLGIGVCAALGPALRASLVPPITAARQG